MVVRVQHFDTVGTHLTRLYNLSKTLLSRMAVHSTSASARTSPTSANRERQHDTSTFEARRCLPHTAYHTRVIPRLLWFVKFGASCARLTVKHGCSVSVWRRNVVNMLYVEAAAGLLNFQVLRINWDHELHDCERHGRMEPQRRARPLPPLDSQRREIRRTAVNAQHTAQRRKHQNIRRLPVIALR